MARLFILIVLFSFVKSVIGQSLTAPESDFTEQTNYPVFTGKDNIYFFCGSNGESNGVLNVTASGNSVLFTWEKYNPDGGVFEFYFSELGVTSSISGLGNGCYRIRFTDNGVDYLYRAWVMNSWMSVEAKITESNCQYFTLSSSASGSDYSYHDLSSSQLVTLSPLYKYQWYLDAQLVSSNSNPTIYNPPTKNSTYELVVTDRAGCSQKITVSYFSIVTKAAFSWKGNQTMDAQYSNYEAPLEVLFTNESENGDPDKYEWFLYKDKSEIENEGGVGGVIDSIMQRLYVQDPVYTYENSGKYKVKLVSAKQSTDYTCRDTFYLKNYIVVDTSLVKVTPVVTPNGDGINDVVIVKTRSRE